MDVRIDEKKIDVSKLLVKPLFLRAVPEGTHGFSSSLSTDRGSIDIGGLSYEAVDQAQFLREYDVTGHKINSHFFYPNKIKVNTDEKGAKTVCEELVCRVAVPFQSIIATKQLIHLCGNAIQFTDTSVKMSDESKETLSIFRQGWINKNMQVAWYESARSEKITGNGAFCAMMQGGKFKWQVFSFEKGDELFPHYNSVSGELELFARRRIVPVGYSGKTKEKVEIWDKTHIYVFEKESGGSMVDRIKSAFTRGWTLVDHGRHGFSRVPIAYQQSRLGACWSQSQLNIENYEMAISQLCENNKAYAFPILFIRSAGDLDMKGGADGRPYGIVASGETDEAKLLHSPDASASFELQIKTLQSSIFLGSFTVLPPEVKSGDLPGVAIKLIFSPALEKAMEDAIQWNLFVDNMVQLFKEGYGIESGRITSFNAMDIHGHIVPYVHQNTSEIVSDLFKGVTAGFISKETASGTTIYGSTDEYHRLKNEIRNEILGLSDDGKKEPVTKTDD